MSEHTAPTPSACRPATHPAPARRTRPVPSPWERAALGRTNLDRCLNIWLNLYGGSCDFDDCVVTTAINLGYQRKRAWNLFEELDEAATVINNTPWAVVAVVAVDTYFAERDTRTSPGRDWRSHEELIDAALFPDGADCQACATGALAGIDHREVAEYAVTQNLPWDRIAAAVTRYRRRHGNAGPEAQASSPVTDVNP